MAGPACTMLITLKLEINKPNLLTQPKVHFFKVQARMFHSREFWALYVINTDQTRPDALCFLCIISINSHNEPWLVSVITIPHFINEKLEAQ